MSEYVFPSFRSDPWEFKTVDPCLVKTDKIVQPKPQLLPGDGLHPSDPDEQWRYQFEMTLDSESALLGYLGLLIDYHEIRMLARFLIGTCSVLELSIPRAAERFPKYRLRWDYASNISLEISTSRGLTIWTNGKPEKVIPLQPSAQDDLRHAISDLWPLVEDYPIWEVISRDGYFFTVRRKYLSDFLL